MTLTSAAISEVALPEPETVGMERALRSLGVSEKAVSVYLALVGVPGGDLADVSARSGLAGLDLAEAVAELVRLGLTETADQGQGGPENLRLADPALAFAAPLRRREAEVVRQSDELASAKAAVATVTAAYQASAGHQARCARPVVTPQEALDLAIQLIAGAAGECQIAFPDPLGTLGQACAQLAGLASGGTRVAVICGDAMRARPARASLDDMTRAGVQIRTLPMVTVPLVVGGTPPAIMLWPGNPAVSAMAVLTRDPAFCSVVAGIFENHWEIATPLHQELSPDPVTGLTPTDRALLAILAAGLDGEAAARRLGTSLTTVRRQVANLKDMLQADSLFQAGCLAAKRGWI